MAGKRSTVRVPSYGPTGIIYGIFVVLGLAAIPIIYFAYLEINPGDRYEVSMRLLSDFLSSLIGIILVFVTSVLVARRIAEIEKLRAEERLTHAIGERLVEIVQEESDVREAGIVRTYRGLPADLIARRIAAARYRVDILQIWINEPSKKYDKALRSINTQVPIRILQADPSSAMTKLRAESQRGLFPSGKFDEQFIAKIVNDNNAYFKKLRQERGLNMKVGCFNTVAPFTIYYIDSIAVIGFYAFGMRASDTPHIEVRESSDLNALSDFASFVSEQFEQIWSGAQQL